MISSAVGGKRAAPKAAARRRPPPQTQPAQSQTSTPTQSGPAPEVEASRDETVVESTTQVGTTTAGSRAEHSEGNRPRALLEHRSIERTPPPPMVKTRARPAAGRTKKRKSAATVVDSDPEADAPEDAAEDEPAQEPAPKPRKRQRRTRKKKDTTAGAEEDGPEDDDDSHLENHEIDPVNSSMFELSYGTRYGKSSEREKKMASIDWVEVARKRHEEVERIRNGDGGAKGFPNQVAGTIEDPASATPAPQEGAEDITGIGLRIVNGQIVEDETTLNIDQTAQAHANATNDEEVEEENDLTERLNRTSYLNNRRRDPRERIPVYKAKSDPWTEEETDRFYDALRMFGTDFDIISKMFPPKTRMHVKKKFCREERIDLARINAALLGKENKAMDLEHYAKEVGRDVSVYTKYDSYEHASQIIRESMKEKEEELAAALQEKSETQRQQEIRQKQQEAAEKKKADRKAKTAARRANKGKKPGVGTMGGGAADEVVVETTED